MDDDLETMRKEKIDKKVVRDPFSSDPEGEKWKEINPKSDGEMGEMEVDLPTGILDCQCSKCPLMDNQKEQKCCREVTSWQSDYCTEGVACLLDLPNFKNIFNVDNHRVLLRIYNTFLCDDDTSKPINSRLRYSAYRGVIAFLYQHLGRRVRVPVPSCIVKAIRDMYPGDPGDEYTGFKTAPASTKRKQGATAVQSTKSKIPFTVLEFEDD